MEMFIVNRYLGSQSNDNASKEKENLNTLLSKIERRKKRKIDSRTERELDTSTSDLNHDSEIKSLENNLETSLRVSGKKKKKKRKLVDESGDYNQNNDHIIETPSNDATVNEGATNNETPSNETVCSEGDTNNRIKTSDDPPASEFMVLGSENFVKQQKVKRVLPNWLAKPSIVSVNLKELHTSVDDVGLDQTLISILKENNITHLFPVQTQVIPWMLSSAQNPSRYWSSDICVSAPTGSGKTLAFVLPIVQILSKRVVPHIRALVILPVQDLAMQVYRVFKTYSSRMNLNVALITGQNSFEKEQQQLIKTNSVFGPQSLVDIVVTTPGRLVDHLKSTPDFSLKHLRFLVIDEADRVMDCIQNDWLYHVNKNIFGDKTVHFPLPLTPATMRSMAPPPQKLLFSATLSQDPEKLQQLGLFQPKLFTSVVNHETGTEDLSAEEERGDFIGKYTTPAELEEKFCVVSSESKPLALYFLITSGKWKNVLCFAESQQSAHRLFLLMKHLSKEKLECAEVSSLLRRKDRDDIIKKFSVGKIDVLFSTDALARGMDIPGVQYVVSYDCPKFIKNYIHRIGRTGRAGKSGTAFTLLLKNQVTNFQNMLHTAGKRNIEEFTVSDESLLPLESEYKAALEQLKEELDNEQNNSLRDIKRKKNLKVKRPYVKTSFKQKKVNAKKLKARLNKI